MARRYFGTDGVRGVVGEPITAELVERLGRAATLWTRRRRASSSGATRARSGVELEEAFARGVVSAGGDCVLGGVLPTPAVALLALDLGVVISASHNPPEYNGVKFFDSRRAQAGRRGGGADRGAARRAAGRVDAGRSSTSRSRPTRYLEHVLERFGSDLARPADRGRLRERRLLRDSRRRRSSSSAPRSMRSATTPTARTSTSAAARPTSALLQALVVERRLRPRDRVRRRRRPHARGRRARRARRRRPDRRDPRADLGVDLVAVTQMTNLGFHG